MDWINNPCYYVSIIDGPQFNVVAGPFQTHQEALDVVESVRKIGNKVDLKSHFYGWGTVKMKNGHAKGILNKHLQESKANAR